MARAPTLTPEDQGLIRCLRRVHDSLPRRPGWTTTPTHVAQKIAQQPEFAHSVNVALQEYGFADVTQLGKDQAQVLVTTVTTKVLVPISKGIVENINIPPDSINHPDHPGNRFFRNRWPNGSWNDQFKLAAGVALGREAFGHKLHDIETHNDGQNAVIAGENLDSFNRDEDLKTHPTHSMTTHASHSVSDLKAEHPDPQHATQHHQETSHLASHALHAAALDAALHMEPHHKHKKHHHERSSHERDDDTWLHPNGAEPEESYKIFADPEQQSHFFKESSAVEEVAVGAEAAHTETERLKADKESGHSAEGPLREGAPEPEPVPEPKLKMGEEGDKKKEDPPTNVVELVHQTLGPMLEPMTTPEANPQLDLAFQTSSSITAPSPSPIVQLVEDIFDPNANAGNPSPTLSPNPFVQLVQEVFDPALSTSSSQTSAPAPSPLAQLIDDFFDPNANATSSPTPIPTLTPTASLQPEMQPDMQLSPQSVLMQSPQPQHQNADALMSQMLVAVITGDTAKFDRAHSGQLDMPAEKDMEKGVESGLSSPLSMTMGIGGKR